MYKFWNKNLQWIFGILFALPWLLFINEKFNLLSGILTWVENLSTGNITDWLQFFTALMSLIATVIVGWIGYKFNRNAEIQNKMAFEEFRPKIDFEKLIPADLQYSVKNTGDFDAENIILFTFFSGSEGSLNNLSFREEHITSSMASGDMKVISVARHEYQSNLLIYSNRSSGILYIKWYNLYTEEGWSYSAVWQKFKENVISPMSSQLYQNISSRFSIKEQIINNLKAETILDLIRAMLKEVVSKKQ